MPPGGWQDKLRCKSRVLLDVCYEAQVEGLKVECHAVHGNFLRENPTNVAVVFHAAPDSIALSHNVPDYNFDPAGLGSEENTFHVFFPQVLSFEILRNILKDII